MNNISNQTLLLKQIVSRNINEILNPQIWIKAEKHSKMVIAMHSPSSLGFFKLLDGRNAR